ncbi:metal-dependent hydrolase [Staphylospora marina]|uniref:metal-dependent hydrolase n=1 Tax=Staphylospora marina TaxID=2490858 RepID=UPI000F5BF456|nr:metal-dependent hydrolase [Staphylospora marina]
MRITYHGHSCFEWVHGSHRILIDPFLSGNPSAKVKPEEIDANWILLTHGHGDHLGDTVSIALRTGATVIAPHELAVWLQGKGVNVHGMGVGGGFRFEFGHVKMTPALHGGAIEADGQVLYGGSPAGYLVTVDGKRIYHAGDTALFSDMKLISRGEPVDLALLPIGDNYTMGPEDALIAAEWLNARHVVPMHYGTFPVIEQDPHAFVSRLEQKGIGGTVMKPGDTLEL